MRYLTALILTFFAFIAPTQAAVPIVDIYTIPGCPGCELAKSMFEKKGILVNDISLQGRRDLYKQMKERVFASMPPSERGSLEDSMSVPRIFINGKYIGGYGDLNSDDLDKLKNNNQPIPSNNPTDTTQQADKNEE